MFAFVQSLKRLVFYATDNRDAGAVCVLCYIICKSAHRWRFNLSHFALNRNLHMASESKWSAATNEKGEFVRSVSSFRNAITADGSSGFKAEKDRYHLYVSLACPWACRVLTVRKLKGLDAVLPYTVVDWCMGPQGWTFTDSVPKCTPDPIMGATKLREVYFKADPAYAGRITVPLLWDKQKQTAVNNESAEIIRMLNSEFNAFCATPQQQKLDLYPVDLRAKIDELNTWIYDDINNGVYKAGFATSQEAYEPAVKKLFAALDRVEGILSKNRFLTGERLTEADVRLFTTLIRFDWVYNGHFKCNLRKLSEYPNIQAYMQDIYNLSGVAETVDRDHIIRHYYVSHTNINPTAIYALGPELDLSPPVERRKKFGDTDPLA